MPDEQAALADPFSVALPAIRKAPPRDGQTALVYGCGPLGMMTIHALAKLYPGVRILAVDLHEYLRPFALAIGAHEYFAAQGAALIERIAQATSAKLRKVRLALPWVTGGVESGRVAPGSHLPGAPTDPDVRDSRIRLLRSWVCCATGTPSCTRSAIRWSRVEMVAGLGVPVIFPSSGSMTWHPLPSTGSSG